MECIEVKDRWLTSSFPVLAPFPSSKQIGQLSMTQPRTQRRIMHRTTLQRGISFVSFSPDSFTSLLVSNEESGKGEVSLAAIKTHHSSNNHWWYKAANKRDTCRKRSVNSCTTDHARFLRGNLKRFDGICGREPFAVPARQDCTASRAAGAQQNGQSTTPRAAPASTAQPAKVSPLHFLFPLALFLCPVTQLSV